MKRPSSHKLQSLITSPSGGIKALLDQLAKIQSLNNTLQSKLNPSLSKHCRIINLRKSTLVIAVDSPAWATKMRFLQNELLSHFRQSGYIGLANIEIIVQPG